MVWSTVAVDIDGGAVFATTGNNYSLQGQGSDSVHAMDIGTGNKKWHTQVRTIDTWSVQGAPSGPDSDFGANPILAEVDGKKIVGAGDKDAAFWAFDRETGQILWSRPDLSASRDASHGGMLNNGAFDGKYFYVVSNQPGGTPTPDGGVPDGGGPDGGGPDGGKPAQVKALLHVLDPKNKGKDVWKPVELPKFTWGAPSLANGLLVVPNDDDLYVFEAATGKQLIMFNTGGTIAAGAAVIVDGRIIVSSGLQYIFDTNVKNNNQVICYGLK
jgi:polyvinyl alcohol dehydrogenase (cytochrome)